MACSLSKFIKRRIEMIRLKSMTEIENQVNADFQDEQGA
jgi:hypothetical protein